MWNEAGGKEGIRSFSQQGEVRPHGAWFTFDVSNQKLVTAITAISHVDAEGARRNLRSDGMQQGKLLSFDSMRQQAQSA